MIKTRNLSKRFGQVQALDAISFEVNAGELFGLIGPDGAGKTTLMRILTTLLLPDSGYVSIDEMDVVKSYRRIRRIIGYMAGRFSLYSDLTVEENLKFYAAVYNSTLREHYHLIADIYRQLEPFRTRPAGKLSGGMKQKLALCCALTHKPRLLILDEPTTGVDAVSRVEFWDILGKLRKEGMTILVSTPYMQEANLCDRIALIQKGRLLSIDQPEKVTARFEKNLLAIRSGETHKLIQDLRALVPDGSVYPFGEFVHLTTDKPADVAQLKEQLLTRDHRELRIEKAEPHIEDVFIDLMRSQP